MAIVAGLGPQALDVGEIDALLAAACASAAAGVNVDHTKILEYRADHDELLVRAGIGWEPGIVGHATVDAGLRSPAGRAFRTGETVFVADLRSDPEFDRSNLLRDHGVVSLLNVPIRTDGEVWGVLEVDAREPRRWGEDEANFLLALAHLVASALRRRCAESKAARERAHSEHLYEELRSSEQRYRTLFEYAAVGIERLTLDGTIVEVNERLCEMLGYAADELIGRTFTELTHPDDLRAELPLVRMLLERRVRSYAVEKRYQRRSGELLWVRVSSSLAEDTENEPYRISVVADITARKRAEAALQESERRLLATYESASVGIAETDLDGRYVRVNPKLCEMLGYTREELLERTFHDVTHPDDRAADEERYNRQQKEQLDSYAVEKRCVRRDGAVIWVQVAASIVRDEAGRPLFGIRIIQEVTERRRAEDELRRLNETLETRVADEIAVRRTAEAALHQAQKMEAVGQLTGGIAHDFNNLLTVVSGNLELLRGRVAEQPRLLRMVEAAMHATERGERLTGQLLAFSRRQQLRPEDVDVNALIRGFETLLRRAAGETVRIEMTLDEALCPARLDPAQLESALLNLVVNARDAMPSGGRIRIETRTITDDLRLTARVPDAASGPWIVVAVCDSGTGMPPEIVERVFEPFFTTKDVGKGSGLGLSQVYGFVRQSGGHVTIDSAPGEGTTIRLYLPPNGTPLAAAPAAAGPPAPRSGSGTVLIVEDDPDVLGVAVNLLHELGYSVVTADDGPSALELLDREKVDLVFTDVVMPRQMSGIELAREAVSRHPGIKVLLTSGYAGAAQPATRPGLAFIRKPYHTRDLAEQMKRLLAAG